VLRTDKTDAPPPRVTPLRGTLALSRRPTLTWPAPSATTCERRLEWKVSTERANLSYPEKQRDLPAGVTRSWEVTARFKGDKEEVVVKSRFNVAAEVEAKQLARLRPLVEDKASEGWVLAVATYEAYGALDEALALYERLARERPEQANYQRALAADYARAGLTKQAEAARQAARKLGADIPEDRPIPPWRSGPSWCSVSVSSSARRGDPRRLPPLPGATTALATSDTRLVR
jgi:hypothetical protein